MRSLTDYQMYGGAISAVENGSAQFSSVRTVLPDSGELVKALLILNAADADATLRFRIKINDLTLMDGSEWFFSIPNGSAQEVPVHSRPTLASTVPTSMHLDAGDTVVLESVPAQTAATSMYIMYIVRR